MIGNYALLLHSKIVKAAARSLLLKSIFVCVCVCVFVCPVCNKVIGE